MVLRPFSFTFKSLRTIGHQSMMEMAAFGLLPLLILVMVIGAVNTASVSAQDKAEAESTGTAKVESDTQEQEKAEDSEATESEPAKSEEADQDEADQDKASEPTLSSEHYLPQSTKAWLSINSVSELEVAFHQTGFGSLASDPDLAPVVESLESQVTDWLDKRNVKFALNMEKLNTLADGELAFAGVLNRVGAQADSVRHAFVILADTKGHKKDVERLLADVEADLSARGAKKSEVEIHGESAIRWELKRPKGIATADSAFFLELNDKLVVCDDQSVFANVVAAIKDPASNVSSLAEYEPFKQIRDRVKMDDAEPAMIRWFIEPFGYVELSDAIRDKTRSARLNPNATEPKEIAAILERQGFSAIKGSGGDIRLAHEGYELLHRGFTFAPRFSEEERFEKAAKMLDFNNPSEAIEVESWVPGDAATCATFHLNLNTALDGMGKLFDEFSKPGNWETTVNGWKKGAKGIKFDIYSMVENLDGKITFYSDFEEPIVEGSERIVVGVKIKPGSEASIEKELDGFFRPQKKKWKQFKVGKQAIWKSEEPKPDEGGLDGLLDELDELDGGGASETAEEETPLFPEQFITVASGHIFFSNDLNYLKKAISGSSESTLANSADLTYLNEKLDELAPGKDAIRQFGRVDRSVKFIYELLRKNQIPRDNSIFGKMMQKMQQGDMAKKIDGSKLPQDFENVVAPHLGLSGWSFENEDNGWFFVGIMVPKPTQAAAAADE